MWVEDSDLLYFKQDTKKSNKIAAFDLDYTIIKTISGNKFPKNKNDWCFLYNNTQEVLNKYFESNYNIVIFSNQSKLKDDKLVNEFKEKIDNILNSLNLDIQVYISKKEGYFRKPLTGMYDTFIQKNNILFVSDKSFYCGDAAGRIYLWKKKNKKDFSCSDRMFANNINLNFHTPELIFNNEPETSKWIYNGIKLTDYILDIHTDYICNSIKSDKQEILMMCGLPASGKSTFCKKYLSEYKIINQDTFKNKSKCIIYSNYYIKNGNSIVIDNTNIDVETRKNYIELSKIYDIPIRAIILDIPLNIVQHLNYYRCQKYKGVKKIIPIIVYRIMKNRYIEPNYSEGFKEIIKINKILDADSLNDKQLFYQYV